MFKDDFISLFRAMPNNTVDRRHRYENVYLMRWRKM
jgi:hypothetical protein